MQEITHNSTPDIIAAESRNSMKRSTHSLVAELLVIFALSLIYRTYMLMSEDVHWQFISLAIHGVLSDLALPYACAVVSLYTGRTGFIKTSHWLNFLIAVLICFDFVHFASFRSRVNTACLNPDIMAFISLEMRLGFAAAAVILMALFNRLSRGSIRLSPTRLKLLTFTSMLLLLINGLKPEIQLSTNNWKDYWHNFSFSIRARPATDSLSALYQLYAQEVTAFQGAAFVESPFFEKSLKKFSERAGKISSSSLIKRIPSLWIQRVNSPSGVRQTFTAGFKGVETTVIYSEEEMDYFVFNSFSSITSIRELPTLENFLHSIESDISPEHYILLNLKELNNSAGPALAQLLTIHGRFRHKNNLIFAAQNPYLLAELTQAGLNTVWWPDYDPSVAVFDNYLIQYIKAAAVLSGCQLIALPSAALNDSIKTELGIFPLMLYEIDQNATWNNPGPENFIRVFLTGNGK